MPRRQLADPRIVLAFTALADLQAKTAHQPANAELDVAELLSCSNFRPVSSARISCAGTVLTCTGRNQPIRISCAMPRASLRSVFTFIAPSAALRCRVSIRIAANPAAVSRSEEHTSELQSLRHLV